MENNALSLFMRAELPTIEGILGLNVKDKSNIPAIALQELEFLDMHRLTKPFINECLPQTVLQAVKYSLKNNLSLDPNAGLIYLIPGSVKVGNEYKKILEIKPTAEGKISMAKQDGTIIHCYRGKVVKDEKGKVVSVSVEVLFNTKPPISEIIEIDQSDFDRLRKFSHVKNSRGKADAATVDYSNPLYRSFNGGIDPEFARSKVVSAALSKRGINLSAKASDKIHVVPQYKEVIEDVTAEVVTAEEGIKMHVQVHEVVILPNPKMPDASML